MNNLSIADYALLKTKEFAKRTNSSSVQYALLDKNQLIHGFTSNYTNGNIIVSDKSMYGIGSVSKTFTAAAIMRLVDLEKLDLDQPVSKYLPEFIMMDNRYKLITPRMLLNHSSAIAGCTTPNMAEISATNNQTDNSNYLNFLLTNLSKQSLTSDPGSVWVYCNDGYTLAEILIKKISQMTYYEFIDQQFIKPLQLFHTKTPDQRLSSKHVAPIFDPQLNVQLSNEIINSYGSGGVYSTATDLVKFASIFFHKPQLELLNPHSVEQMTTIQLSSDIRESSFGLGFDDVELDMFKEYGICAITKGGDTHFYHASLVILPKEQLAMAVLSTNGNSSLNTCLANHILSQYLKLNQRTKQKQSNSFLFTQAQNQRNNADLLGDDSYNGTYSALGGAVLLPPRLAINKTNQTITLKHFLCIDQMLAPSDLQEYPENNNTQISLKTTPDELVYHLNEQGYFVNKNNNQYIKLIKYNGQNFLKYNSRFTLSCFEDVYLMVTSIHCQISTMHVDTVFIEEFWCLHNNRSFLPIKDNYNSMLYLRNIFGHPYSTIRKPEDKNLVNYCNTQQITGINNAKHFMPYAINTWESTFFVENGMNYLRFSDGGLFICCDDIPILPNLNIIQITISTDGHAHWFKIEQQTANKQLSFDIPANALLAIYDQQGNVFYHSLVSGSIQTISLPDKGYVLLVGDKLAIFTLKIR